MVERKSYDGSSNSTSNDSQREEINEITNIIEDMRFNPDEFRHKSLECDARVISMNVIYELNLDNIKIVYERLLSRQIMISDRRMVGPR